MKTKVEPPPHDASATVDHLKALVREFCEERGWTDVHNPKDLAIGLVTEASELLEIFRFRSAAEIGVLMGDPGRREAVADELADALYCILRFAEKNEFDLARALRDKLVKTARKYPVHQ